MKPLIIINPNAGGGKTGQQLEKLERLLESSLGPLEVKLTERPRQAAEFAEQAALTERQVIVAVGGDGTLHELVNGLMRAREKGATLPRVGIVGQGTGGDFRRTLGIPNEPEAFCAAIASGKTRALDVGRFSYRDESDLQATAYFINILSVGMGGLVDRYVAAASRALGGTIAYFGASLRALRDSQVAILQCQLEQGSVTTQHEIATRSLAICNGKFFGSGMQVAPMAEPDDGQLHVVALSAASRLKFAAASLSIYSGNHVNQSDVQVLSCNSINIELKNREIRNLFPLDVDGEPFGYLPIRVELVPQALEIFVGEH
jgi:diacylglycerol kinase (ATP)